MDRLIIDEKVKLDKYKYIMSQTDTNGIIEFANDYFMEISGYSEAELLGKPHNIIRHPDMPKIIFKLMWERLQSGRSIYALVKNRAKSGRYYWVTTQFNIKYDPTRKKCIGYLGYRQAANPKAVKGIEPLYAKLLEIEKAEGMGASEKYLIEFLATQGKSYDEYIHSLALANGAIEGFFNAMKKFFS
jgi:PAS domain S-box-containing protein